MLKSDQIPKISGIRWTVWPPGGQRRKPFFLRLLLSCLFYKFFVLVSDREYRKTLFGAKLISIGVPRGSWVGLIWNTHVWIFPGFKFRWRHDREPVYGSLIFITWSKTDMFSTACVYLNVVVDGSANGAEKTWIFVVECISKDSRERVRMFFYCCLCKTGIFRQMMVM